jgi:hypothetical protein
LRIADQPNRESALWVLPKGLMVPVRRLVDLRITNDTLAQLPAVLGGLRADPEDGDVVFLVSSILINKGRNLGPTPRSPLTAIEKNNGGWRSLEHRRKLHWLVVDIFQTRFGKVCAKIQ